MRKQLISVAQLIKFCKTSSSKGGFNPNPLAYAFGYSCQHIVLLRAGARWLGASPSLIVGAPNIQYIAFNAL